MPAWELTSHASAQLPMVLKSVLRMAADVRGESTTKYKLVSSANRRILAPMFLTMPFTYIRNSSGQEWNPEGHLLQQKPSRKPGLQQLHVVYGQIDNYGTNKVPCQNSLFLIICGASPCARPCRRLYWCHQKLLLLLYHNLLLHRQYDMYVTAGTWLSLLGQSQTAEELRYDLPWHNCKDVNKRSVPLLFWPGSIMWLVCSLMVTTNHPFCKLVIHCQISK